MPKKLLVAALLGATLMTAPAWADPGPCGSAEAFSKSHRWQDLPGCVGAEEGASDWRTPEVRLALSKKRLGEFLQAWEAGDFWDTDFDAKWSNADHYIDGSQEQQQWESDPDLQAAKPLFEEVHAKCAEIKKKLAAWKPKLNAVYQAYNNAGNMMTGDHNELSVGMVKDLKDAIADADAAHVEDSVIVVQKEKISYGQIKARLASLDKQATGIKTAKDAAAAAKIAPYTKLLSGDKLRIFKERFADLDSSCYGPGGKELTAPAAWAKSSIWASYSHDRNGIQPRWNLSVWHFNGMKLVKITTNSGWGEDPPSSAFK